jgi:superfamily II DNA/RNA helicase
MKSMFRFCLGFSFIHNQKQNSRQTASKLLVRAGKTQGLLFRYPIVNITLTLCLLLVYLLNEFSGQNVIIFTVQCLVCQRVTLMLRNLGMSAIPLNGKMDQDKRLGALTRFKAQV